MAQHVWSVLCRKGIVERDTNLVTLWESIERVNLHVPMEEIEKKAVSGATLAHPMELVSWWVRSDFDQPEKIFFRIIWMSPSLEEISGGSLSHDPTGADAVDDEQGFEIDLLEKTGRRFFLRLPGIPWAGLGIYWIVVQARNEGSGEWRVETRVPIEVVLALEPAAEEEDEGAAPEDRP